MWNNHPSFIIYSPVSVNFRHKGQWRGTFDVFFKWRPTLLPWVTPDVYNVSESVHLRFFHSNDVFQCKLIWLCGGLQIQFICECTRKMVYPYQLSKKSQQTQSCANMAWFVLYLPRQTRYQLRYQISLLKSIYFFFKILFAKHRKSKSKKILFIVGTL